MPGGRPDNAAEEMGQASGESPWELARAVTHDCAERGVTEAAALVLHPHADQALNCAAVATRIRWLRRFALTSGIRLTDVAWAGSAPPGSPWFGPSAGVIPRLVVVAGRAPRHIAPRYTGLPVHRQLDPPDPGGSSERAATFPDGGVADPYRAQRLVIAAVKAARAGRNSCLTDKSRLECLRALKLAAVRAQALAMTLETPEPLWKIWWQLTRTIPGPGRAPAAALLAVASFLCGDIAVAQEASEAGPAPRPGKRRRRERCRSDRSGLAPGRSRSLHPHDDSPRQLNSPTEISARPEHGSPKQPADGSPRHARRHGSAL